jgi:hypothetical protein
MQIGKQRKPQEWLYELNKMSAPSTPHLVQKSKPSTYKQENHHHPIALRAGVAWWSEGHDRSTTMVMSPAMSTSQQFCFATPDHTISFYIDTKIDKTIHYLDRHPRQGETT